MKRKWLINRTNREFLLYLSRNASISPLLAQVLVNRGIKDAGGIADFLAPSLSNTHDPFLMPDMRAAVMRLKAAVEKKESVMVHGDYDADGITATALLVSAFRRLGLSTTYHIPNRIREGYGVSDTGLERAVSFGASLIVTADCGVSSENEIISARSLGIDVIVTDHHQPPEKLPPASAVIDPHRKDSQYPFTNLAGVGVAYKFVQALYQEFGVRSQESGPAEFLDLVALGTIADSVPLLGENRIFVTFGLKRINDSLCRTGVRALMEASGVNGNSQSGSLSYSLIPRINAAGRIDDAGRVVDLFLTEDEKRAKEIAALLEEQNRARRKIEAEVLKEALEMISPDALDSAIVLSSPDWHPGVIGIVASRLLDMFYRPVFLFSVKDSVAKGSARGVPPLHLYNAINKCSELLLGFGGHRQAAGLRIELDRLTDFSKKIKEIADHELSPADMVPSLGIDAALRLSEINSRLIKELALLEPYGDSNPEPVFGAKDINVVNQRIVGNNHLKMQLKQDSFSVDTIGFSMGDQLKAMEPRSTLDIAFTPGINEWKGTRSLQLNLKAIRPGSK